MPPTLTLCYCDLAFNKGRPVLSVCPACAKRQHDALLVMRLSHQGAVRDAFDALAASYDAADRARDAADAHRLDATA